MTVVGRIESLWRYPVKSMRGEQLQAAFAGFPACTATASTPSAVRPSSKGFPYFTGRDQGQMLRYRAAFRHPDRMAAPPNLAEAEALGPGITPLYADVADLLVDVTTPTGEILAIDDPRLLDLLRDGAREGHELSVIRSERALTDCRPFSLFSLQTARQLSEELGVELGTQRFRANAYVDLTSGAGFDENEWVGRRLRIGAKAEIAVTDRDPRCKMITLDPDTGLANPEVMRRVAKDHGGTAGVYCAVVVEGVIRAGDEIRLVDFLTSTTSTTL